MYRIDTEDLNHGELEEDGLKGEGEKKCEGQCERNTVRYGEKGPRHSYFY